MNRPEIYQGAVPRAYDLLKGWRDAQKATDLAALDGIGGFTAAGVRPSEIGLTSLAPYNSLPLGNAAGLTTGLSGGLSAVVSGFAFYPTTNAFASGGTGVAANIGGGDAYVLAEPDEVDATIGAVSNPIGTGTLQQYPQGSYGGLTGESTIRAVQCIGPASTNSGSAPGQTRNAGQLLTGDFTAPASGFNAYLVYAVPQINDTTDSDDPNFSSTNALLPFYNSADPTSPLNGPAGSGSLLTTARESVVWIAVSTASAGATEAAAAGGLSVPSGCIPLYLIDVAAGDTTLHGVLAAGRVYAVGLGSGTPALTGSPVAPFLRGVTTQHHLGVPGSAPKIDGGAEWAPLSAVSNNGQDFTNFGALRRGSGTPTLTLNDTTDFSAAIFNSGIVKYDNAFVIELTAGTGATLNRSTPIVTITFGSAYAVAPAAVVCRGIDTGAAGVLEPTLSTSTTTVVLYLAGTTSTSAVYRFHFIVIG